MSHILVPLKSVMSHSSLTKAQHQQRNTTAVPPSLREAKLQVNQLSQPRTGTASWVSENSQPCRFKLLVEKPAAQAVPGSLLSLPQIGLPLRGLSIPGDSCSLCLCLDPMAFGLKWLKYLLLGKDNFPRNNLDKLLTVSFWTSGQLCDQGASQGAQRSPLGTQ